MLPYGYTWSQDSRQIKETYKKSQFQKPAFFFICPMIICATSHYVHLKVQCKPCGYRVVKLVAVKPRYETRTAVPRVSLQKFPIGSGATVYLAQNWMGSDPCCPQQKEMWNFPPAETGGQTKPRSQNKNIRCGGNMTFALNVKQLAATRIGDPHLPTSRT